MPPAISICILAHNEEDKIALALKSARDCPWCDELLIFDSGSTDATPAIARRFTDRVEYHPWVNFTANRRLIVDAARNDWVFLLDADEEISPALRDEIASLPDALFAAHPVFTMPRKNYLLGRHVRAYDPDRIDRLFNRTAVTWPDRLVHDTRIPKQGSIRKLKSPILHNRLADSFTDYFDGPRFQKRTDQLAKEMYDQGKRVSFMGLAARPLFAFLKFYLLKGAFLQGSFGLLIAQKAALSTQLKYARLHHLQGSGQSRTG